MKALKKIRQDRHRCGSNTSLDSNGFDLEHISDELTNLFRTEVADDVCDVFMA